MLDYTKMTFTEFNNAIDEDLENRLHLTIDAEDWQIWKDTKSGKFFYIESGTNDASDFYEVRPIARLEYDVLNDIQCKPETLFDLFKDYDFCGEQVTENKIIYWWFKEVV